MTYMLQLASRFLREKEGQDLVEYTLLMGFVALAAAALFPPLANNIRIIWNTVSAHLSNAVIGATT